MRLAVAVLAAAVILVPGASSSGVRLAAHGCGPFFLARLPSLGTLTWRTTTRNGRDWHGLGYRPTPPIATTQVRLTVGPRTVARRAVNENAVRLPLIPNRVQLVTFSQMTEPGTLRATVRVDFKPGAVATYCEPYFPPGLAITLTPRS
jgi:hypothetical protein